MQSHPRPAEGGQRLPGAGPRKRRLSKFSTVKLVNPVVRRLLEAGVFPRTHALLETRGRKSGLPRRVPIGNGLRGNTFWIVTEHGNAADYVKNIRKDPRVRVKVGRRWFTGTAHVLPEEDARQRLRELNRPVNDAMLRLVGTEMLVIRVDLDSLEGGR
jgi:deazaflavin-dependent oxidoreductase (nitroreductase family)